MANSEFDPAAAQRTATFIGLSLALGVTMFAAVVWFIQQQVGAPPQNDPAFVRLLIYLWIGVTAVTSFASLYVWRSRVEPLISSSEPLPAERVTELTSSQLICLGLIEGASLFGVVVYLLSGIMWPAIVGVSLIWFAVFATRPQLEWYQRFR